MKRNYLVFLLFFNNVFCTNFDYQFRSQEIIQHQITIAELSEQIEKIQNDIKKRAHLLKRNDKSEIIKILKNVEKKLSKNLLEIETQINNEINANKKKVSPRKKLLKTVGMSSVFLSIACLAISSIDKDEKKWQKPTLDNLIKNITELYKL